MAPVQFALNVEDLDAAVAFCPKMFDAEPSKRRPGHAMEDKVWADDPDGAPWEACTVLADIDETTTPR